MRSLIFTIVNINIVFYYLNQNAFRSHRVQDLLFDLTLQYNIAQCT